MNITLGPSFRLPAAVAALGAVVGLLLTLAVSVVALGSGAGLIALPFEMWLLDQKLPGVFRLHMLASALALVLLPVAIGLRRHAKLHRRTGWLLGAFVVIGGLTAFPVAIWSHSSLVARSGFFVQGIVWIGLLATAIAAIRSGDRQRHALLMLAMAAVTTGAVWFRVLTGSAIWLQLPFEPAYAASAWLGWLVPLGSVMLLRDRLLRWAFRSGRPSVDSRPLARPAPMV